jgi:hypothetical protein
MLFRSLWIRTVSTCMNLHEETGLWFCLKNVDVFVLMFHASNFSLMGGSTLHRNYEAVKWDFGMV